MTSISSFNPSQMGHVSPRDRLQSELTSEISAGSINATDQAALSAAIDEIDSSLKSAGETARKSGSTRPSPDEMKSKISDLIAEQVSAGKLTSEQAEELSNIFEQTLAGGAGGPPPGGGPGGPGGPGGAGGAPGGTAKADDDSSSTSSTSSTSTDDDIMKLLTDFMKALQDKVSQNSGYSSNGQTSSVSASLIINFES
jgi:uncharacterized membrane protein YdfJ with MMPL/SSD domain